MESAMRNGRKSTEAVMSSTPYSTQCNDFATYHNAGGNQQQYYCTKWVTSDISNWRPITLSNTLAKLYASVLAGRLGLWAVRNDRISINQKGFIPVDGCCEHNFVLQSTIVDARRSKRHCSVAWLDLTNVFGSGPHETIFTSLQVVRPRRRRHQCHSTPLRNKHDNRPQPPGIYTRNCNQSRG